MAQREKRAARRRLYGAVLLALTVTALTAGAVYKWVDKEGKVHYSDTPPPGESEVVRTEPGPTPEQRSQAQQRAEAIAEEVRRTEAARASADKPRQATAAETPDPALAARRCADAMVQRKTLELQSPVYRRSGPGNFEYLADADRPAEERRLDESIARYCSDDPAQAPLVRQRFVELSLGRRPACVELRDELEERVLRGESSASEGVQRVAARLQQFHCPDDVPVDGVWLSKHAYQLQPPR